MISRASGVFLLFALIVFAADAARAQSAPADNGALADNVDALDGSSNFSPVAPASLSAANPSLASSPDAYVPPTQEQKFHDFTWNAFGPVAFAGSAVAAAIDQSTDFPHQWGQGDGAYGARVASNFGIGLVTVTAEYSLAEAFHEDTRYYRCTCSGFFPRLWHAAVSTFASRRGDEGDFSFSVALTASPFIGPMAAVRTWIPDDRDRLVVGFRLGSNNLLGQFAQNEALEFLYGGPRTLLGHIQHHFFKKPFDGDSKD